MKEKYKIEKFKPLVENSTSIRDLCRLLNMAVTGRNFYTMKKYIKLYEIDVSHYLNRKDQVKELHFKNKIPIENILVENSTYLNNKSLKKRLLDEELLEYICQKCNNEGRWEGKDLVLQLDHKNGIRNDNRLLNLRFLCPNCHSQTDTFCGKHLSKKVEKTKERLKNGGKTDKELIKIFNRRKVKNRPSILQIKKDVLEIGYLGAGRKYGVSDNTIRKWLK